MRRLTLVLPLIALLGGCANPNVPAFMVEGRLPDFEGKTESKPAPKVAEAPKPVPQVAVAPKPTQNPPKNTPKTTQNTPEIAPEPTPNKPAKRTWLAMPQKAEDPAPITGGFSPVTDKKTIDSVSAFAMQNAPHGYLLKGVKSVKYQVVAGINYELCLRVRTPGHEANWIRQRLVKAVVWQKLDQSMELTSWNEVEECQ